MARPHLEFDPYANDPARWGHSLANMAEILVSCLDAAKVRSVVEIGAYTGGLTGVLADWAAGCGARVWAIDPSPQEELVRLDSERSELELVRATSFASLPSLPDFDAAIIDGDHNYYTVAGELRLVAERAAGAGFPLLMLHDVCWPHGRRDNYFSADEIPEEHRHPIVESGGLFPGEAEAQPGGLPYSTSAAREGGSRNGVLTAAEDFVAERECLRLVVVPIFFGLGVIWHRDAPWDAAVAEILDPWDRSPVLERLEANRIHHLALAHEQLMRVALIQEQRAREEGVLRRLLGSSAFSVAERLSRVRHRVGVATEQPVISKEEIRRVLGD